MNELHQPVACFLCGVKLDATSVEFIRLHPPSTTCDVVLADPCGLSLDDSYELIAGQIFERVAEQPKDPDVLVAFEQFLPTEQVTAAMFDHFGVPRLGGASGDLGWSSFSTWQHCRYLYKRTYLDHVTKPIELINPLESPEPFGLAVGGLVHTLLAIHYYRKLDRAYPVTPEQARDYLEANKVDPDAMTEAWRLFAAHRLFYKHEAIEVLAVEYHVVHPQTRHSARYDLILKVREEYEGHLPGTYYMDHKTALIFDRPTLEGWANDGTVIQQAMIWQQCGLKHRFGELQGAIINLIGKQKVPNLHRTWVIPNQFQIDAHAQDLKIHYAERRLAMATGVFPRSRAGCITRHGMCSQWDHCATGEG